MIHASCYIHTWSILGAIEEGALFVINLSTWKRSGVLKECFHLGKSYNEEQYFFQKKAFNNDCAG